MSSTPEHITSLTSAGAHQRVNHLSVTARASRRRAAAVVGVVALAVSLSNCSADSGQSTDAPPDATGGTPDEAANDDVTTTYGGDTAGTVMVSSSAITGQAGQMLLVFATSKDQGRQAGVACVQITSDPFLMPSTMLTEVPGGGNPCAGGSAVAVLRDGEYVLSAGVYEPGSQQPSAQMSLDFAMDGGAFTFELLGANLSSS